MIKKQACIFNLILSVIIAILLIGIVDKFVINRLLSNQISFNIKYPNNDGFLICSSKSASADPVLHGRTAVNKNRDTHVSYSIAFANAEYLDLNFGSVEGTIELSNIKVNDIELKDHKYLIYSIKSSSGLTSVNIYGETLHLVTADGTAKLTLGGVELGMVVYNSVIVDLIVSLLLTAIVFYMLRFIEEKNNFIQKNRIALSEILFIISYVSFILLNNIFVFNIEDDSNVQLIKYNKLLLSLKNNLWIIFLFVLIISLSRYVRYLAFRMLITVFALLFVAIYVADLFSYQELHTHLNIFDVIQYISGSDDIESLIVHFFCNSNNWLVISFVLSGLLFISFQLFSRTAKIEKTKCSFIARRCCPEIAFLTLAIMFQFMPHRITSDAYLYDNLIKSNYLSWNANKNFSYEHLKELNYKHETVVNSSHSAEQKKNVILIVIESLTFSKSKYFSKLEDKMPYLDKLAKDNIAFMNYYSNGSNSITGNYSVATNNPFIFNDTSSVLPDYLYDNTLAKIFKKHGYKTSVFSAPRLVYGMEQVYKNSGFDYISDDKDPYYSGKPRYVFNGVSDDVLYENVISNVKNETDNFFYMLNTVTTHPPYLNPITGESSFDSTIEFAEKALETFVNQLEESNFFDNGILVIVGDHRSMTPISDLEYEKYGEWSSARMPLVIIDKEIKHLSIDDHLSHASLGSIIQYLSLPQVVMSKEQGNPFLHKKELVVFNQYSRRNEVFIRYGNDFEIVLYLSGDDSYLSKSSGEAAFDNEIIGYIAWLRERVSDK